MVPDPVAFGPLLEERDLEGQVFFDEQQDLALRDSQIGCCSGGGIAVLDRRYVHAMFFFLLLLLFLLFAGIQLGGKDRLENDAAVIPDGIVLRVLVQELRGELESGVGEVVGGYLCLATIAQHYANDNSLVDFFMLTHPLKDVALQRLVLHNVLLLLVSIACALFWHASPADSMLWPSNTSC